MRIRVSALLLVTAIIALACASTWACSVPVFRYALLRWEPEPYDLYVFHRGKLGAEDQKLVAWLEARSTDIDSTCNMTVTPVDVGSKDALPEDIEIWKKHKDAKLPLVVLRYPQRYQKDDGIWSGALTPGNLMGLVHSPLRKTIVANILRGDCAVWVLLESGDKKKDDAAAKLVKDEIAKAQKNLALSEVLEEDMILGLEPQEDMKIEFSMLRLSRKDPAEKILVSMLLGTEDDLEASSEPIVFPIIGRGRSLCALLGKGISADNIGEIGQYLVGPCSCIVKEENPGYDILFTTDWSDYAEGAEIELPKPPGFGIIPEQEVTAVPEAIPIGPAPKRSLIDFVSDGSWWAVLLLIAVGIGLVAIAITVIILTRSRSERV